ncbi:hypothetical protein WOLCODRAFT_164986 [Wolfiporia cocos MD-104 SS10]|uniref:F-box domain-containing protein n=1 Tax=Wolfiporia cocos (strain MD-104) TaxID=742152 RepID=A0A2H3K6Z8_WOLCO|nr:hypothetical protein WOLCODRAFT_164986 [Wolfiporia cocos MD-104 SS10]
MSVALIHTLNDDCLYKMLHLVVSEAPVLSKRSLQSRTSVLAVTHVCARWRNLALAAPWLWTCIRFARPINQRLLPELLSRSSGLPLRLTYYGRAKLNYDNLYESWNVTDTKLVVNIVAAEAGRLYQLALYNIDGDEWYAFWVRLKETHLPQLQSLRISTPFGGFDHVLNEPILGGDNPTLRELSVHRFYLSLPNCTGLTSLILKDVQVLPTKLLLKTVRHNPNIEELHLEQLLLSDTTSTQDPPPSALLP